jgi:hypothetical protein
MSRNDPADMTINIGLQMHLILENSLEIYDKNFSDLSSRTIFDIRFVQENMMLEQYIETYQDTQQ